MSNSRITHPSSGSITPEQARDARARAWKFIFDAYRKKAAKQDNIKTKQKSLNTEEGDPRDLKEDIFAEGVSQDMKRKAKNDSMDR